jgi:hypothetical protein
MFIDEMDAGLEKVRIERCCGEAGTPLQNISATNKACW